MNAQTHTKTHTWTHTRLETLQDQFHYLLMYADIQEKSIAHVLTAVGNREVSTVGIFGTDDSGLRVIEVALQVDWDVSAKLTLVTPSIASGLPGWQDDEAPEIRVSGHRFAEVAKTLNLKTSFWVRFIPEIQADDAKHRALCERYGLGFKSSTPGWKATPEERTEGLLDLPEANIAIRRAGSP